MKVRMDRRAFLAAGGVCAAALGARGAPVDAADRLRVGFIGVGNRGSQLLRSFLKLRQVEVAALCDVDARILEAAAKLVPGTPRLERDFRAVLDRADIDAVVISTPDHWHAIQCILACAAGKDVYIEKPLSMTVREGRAMVDAARRHGRVVQVGIQRRSSEIYARLVAMVRDGVLGKVTVGRAYRLSNMAPSGIGKAPDTDPPPWLDWDLWLGPRPYRPYRESIHPYKFRWWGRYSSQVANWGVHYFDAIRWAVGSRAPSAVVALGGVYAVDDDRTIPDTVEVVHELPEGCLAIFGQYEGSTNAAMRRGDIELRGTLGTAYPWGGGLEIVPERGGQFQSAEARMEPMDLKSAQSDATDAHTRNFIECVYTRRKPNADVEDGHRSTTFALLGNIALEARARIEWDADKEVITAPVEANEHLHYAYRAPWSLPEA